MTVMATSSEALGGQVRMAAEVGELDSRAFTVHCYTTILRRSPEFIEAADLESLEAKVDFLLAVLSSDEVKLTPNLGYTGVLRRLAAALGRSLLTDLVIEQVVETYPALDDFWAGQGYLREQIVEATRAVASATGADLELRLGKAVSAARIAQQAVAKQATEIAELREALLILSGRVRLLEQEAF
jgi:hypothetical protein